MTDFLRLVLYGLASLAIGFAVIVVPSSGFLFRDPALYGISDGQYGVLFLPMVTATIVTGFGYQALTARFGRHRLFLAGFVFSILYLAAVLTASFLGQRPAAVFTFLLLAQTLLGFGFALLMTSISVFSIELFPNHRTSILTGLHAMFGAGALLSPLVLNLWHRAHFWQGQVIVGVIELFILGVAALRPASVPVRPADLDPRAASTEPSAASLNPLKTFARLPGRAKGFVAALVFYGTIEAVVANWSTIYLTRDRGFSATTASVCLALFWGFLTLGRVGATVAAIWIDPRYLFRAAPFVAMAGLLWLGSIRVEAEIFLPYALVGFGCSYTFPVSVSLTTGYHDSRREVLPSFMLAGLMLGIGVGSTSIGFLRGAGWLTLEQAFLGAVGSAAALCGIFFLLTRPPLPKTR